MPEAKTAKEAKKEDSILSEKNRVNFDWFKFENIGDHIIGWYVAKFNTHNEKYNYDQENYVLLKDDTKEKIVVGGRNTRKSDGVRVIYGMEKIPLGARVAFIFDREIDTGKGNPAKIIEVRYEGEKDQELAREFNSTYNFTDEPGAEEEYDMQDLAGEPVEERVERPIPEM